jgi:hypothetical protein
MKTVYGGMLPTMYFVADGCGLVVVPFDCSLDWWRRRDKESLTAKLNKGRSVTVAVGLDIFKQ